MLIATTLFLSRQVERNRRWSDLHTIPTIADYFVLSIISKPTLHYEVIVRRT